MRSLSCACEAMKGPRLLSLAACRARGTSGSPREAARFAADCSAGGAAHGAAGALVAAVGASGVRLAEGKKSGAAIAAAQPAEAQFFDAAAARGAAALLEHIR